MEKLIKELILLHLRICVYIIAALGYAFPLNLLADEKVKFLSDNGVELNVAKDTFANSQEVTGPSVKLKNPDDIPSYGFVARSDSRGKIGKLTVQGFLFGYGEQNNFSDLMPIFRGGEPLKISITGRTKLGCSWTCQYAYHFVIEMPMEKVKKHVEDGGILLQFRSPGSSWKPTLTIPIEHFEAIYKFK